jgi:protein SCO1/2
MAIRSSTRAASLVLLSILAGCAAAGSSSGGRPASPEESCCAAEGVDGDPAPADSLRRSVDYPIPQDLVLIDQHGTPVSFEDAIVGDTPVALNFVFTTCTTICPVMTATFARLHDELGDDGADLRLVSISLDPQYDTPPVLREYAERFGATEQWRFFTGDAERLSDLYQQFEVLTGTNKMTHLPFVLFRFPGEDGWIRVEGLRGTGELAAAYRALRRERE